MPGCLDEKQRRLFFGLEAERIGYGGCKMLVEEFATSYNVISRGWRELADSKVRCAPERVRHPGGGCKLTEDRYPEIFDVLEEIMSGHIAGDPMNENVRWTDKNLTRIRNQLAEKGYELCVNTVKRLVKKILAQQAGQKEGDQPEPGSGPTVSKDQAPERGCQVEGRSDNQHRRQEKGIPREPLPRGEALG